MKTIATPARNEHTTTTTIAVTTTFAVDTAPTSTTTTTTSPPPTTTAAATPTAITSAAASTTYHEDSMSKVRLSYFTPNPSSSAQPSFAARRAASCKCSGTVVWLPLWYGSASVGYATTREDTKRWCPFDLAKAAGAVQSSPELTDGTTVEAGCPFQQPHSFQTFRLPDLTCSGESGGGGRKNTRNVRG